MKKILMIISAAIAIFFSFSLLDIEGNKAKAATIGLGLEQPEAGWVRYDDAHPFIKYEGNWLTNSTGTFYNNTLHYADKSGAKVHFTFKGTKIRLIGFLYNNRSDKISIKIDGISEKFSQYGSPTTMSLDYEKTGLTESIHTVEIELNGTGVYLIDAIDIDDTGELLDPNNIIVDSLELNKETLDLTVGSSESLVATITPEDATNKAIKWTSSDPEIASVDNNGNVIGKKPGKVTITAETTDGSNLSATAEVTVKESDVNANRAILRLTMTTKDIHEYDLSISEIEQFINWLDGREAGHGKPYYKFKLNVTTGNIVSRTEYIMYDKIVSFTVDDYK
ncbi:Ig-like domain-containing protein [Lysinibacillus sp. NPDC056959]|uniref:Ig-like domain-containing protein n=1 Tax=Lysinibacillus sp. NPDC056959 TaxID=3345981 RepID=UPI00362B03B3